MAPWKIALAAQLREQVAAPYSWPVHTLSLGHPGRDRPSHDSVRSSVWPLRDSQRVTA